MMTALRFVSEIISGTTNVFVTRSKLPLAQEIIRQLKQRSRIQVKEIVDPTTEDFPADADVTIHFAGFEKPSLAESLFHTSTLHRLMDWAIKTRSKLVVVLPENNNPETQTAISLLSQFGKNFSLNYVIAKVHTHDSLEDIAEAIIATFIKGHKRLGHRPEVAVIDRPVVVSRPLATPKPKVSRQNWGAGKWLLAGVLGFLIIPWLIYVSQFGLITLFWRCASCANLTAGLVRAVEIQTNWVLGASQVIASTGLSESEFFSALVRGIEAQVAIDQILIDTERLWSEPSHDATQQLAVHLGGTSEQLAYLQTDVQKAAWALPRFQQTLTDISQNISSARIILDKYGIVAADIASIAQSSQQTWLILLQDSHELRPSGGYLGSFALVTLGSGKVMEMKFHTTYATDGLLRGQVIPPDDLQAATGESNWYMRDSNWATDFSEVAERTAWFVDKELGQKVDGVIALNTSVLPVILSTIGPLTSSEFDGEVTAANSADRLLDEAQPDSAQTPFVERVSRALFSKLGQASDQQRRQVLQDVVGLLERRQILIEPLNTAHRFGLVGWNGGRPRELCGTESACVDDYIYFVDSNVGVNKANAGVTSSYVAEVVLGEASISHVYTVDYTNANTSSSWPLGDYKNYLRVILPRNTVVTEVQVDDKTLTTRDYALTQEDSYMTLGVLVDVPTETTRSLKITTQRGVVFPDQANYRFQWFNQPGASSAPVALTVSHPQSLQVVAVPAAQVASAGQLRYNTHLVEPFRLHLSFSRTP